MSETKETALIDKKGLRHDGRKKDDLREIKFEIGVLDRADGSALIHWGKNKILAAVYGPRELHPKHMALPDRALIRCEYRMATFSVPERKSPAPKRREKEISKILAEALEPAVFDYLYPRSVIDIFIEVLQADGGSRCAAITVASLALADAGVPMRDLAVGCAAGNLNGNIVIDLDDVEDKEGQGDLPLAYLPNTEEVVLLQSDGEFSPEQFTESLDMVIPACKKIYQMQRDALTNKYSRITLEISETDVVDVHEISEPTKIADNKDPSIEKKGEEKKLEEVVEELATKKNKSEQKKSSSKEDETKKKGSHKDRKKQSSKSKPEMEKKL